MAQPCSKEEEEVEVVRSWMEGGFYPNKRKKLRGFYQR